MTRTTAAWVAGALIGMVTGYLSVRAVHDRRAEEPTQPAASADRGSAMARASQSNLDDARLAVYRQVSRLEDPPSIEQAIRRLARSTPSRARDVELEALLLRFLELDAGRAAGFAVAEALDRQVIEVLFQAWASVDPDAALTALAAVTDDKLRRTVAMALVGLVQGPDAIDELAAIGGQGSPKGFVVRALEQLATYDPDAAIRQAASLGDDALQSEAFLRIAAEWADLDATTALNYVAEISNPLLRHSFHAAVLDQWFRSDPGGALAYIGSSEGRRLLSIVPQEMVGSIASTLLIDRPEEMLLLADGLDEASARVFQQRAESALVQRNLPAALARFDELPSDSEARASLLARIASAYAREDPEAGLEWARQLDEESAARALQRIIQEGIGRTDPIRAFDLALESDVRFNPSPPTLLSDLSADEFLALAYKLVVNGEPQQQAVNLLMQAWPRRDPAAQWEWLVRQGGSADPVLIQNAAAGFGNLGIALPAQAIYELPENLRKDWVVSFVDEYGRLEPDAAVAWLAELKSDPAYDDWAAEAASRLLGTSLARMQPGAYVHVGPGSAILASMTSPPQNLVAVTASYWARTEPDEVTRWVLTLPDSDVRSYAVLSGIGGWTVADPAGARQWVLGLPDGELRDRALVAQMAQDIATHGTVDQRVANAIGSREDVEAAIISVQPTFMQIFRALGSRDRARAMELFDRYVASAELRSELEASIDSTVAAGVVIPADRLYLLVN